MARECAGFVVLLENEFKPPAERLDLHRFSNGRYLRLTSSTIFHRLEVEGKNVFLLSFRRLLIKPLAGLVTQSASLELCSSHGANCRITQDLTRFVVFDQIVKVLADCDSHIEANKILQTKDSRSRAADERPHDRISLFDGVSILQNVFERHRAGHRSVAVGNKVWRVFANDDALAESILRERLYEFGDTWIGIRGWNHFEQLHVALRIEEVRPEKMSLEIGGRFSGNRAYG